MPQTTSLFMPHSLSAGRQSTSNSGRPDQEQSQAGPLLTGLILILLLSVGACASTPPSRFFILSPTQDSAPSTDLSGNGLIRLEPVRLPEYLNRPHIITRLGPNRLRLAEFDKWAEPLDVNVTRVLAKNLETRLKAGVIFSPHSSADHAHVRIQVQVLRFDCGPDGSSTLVARWVASMDDHGRSPITRETTSTRKGTGTGYEAAAQAMSLNLEDLAADIATTLKSSQFGDIS